ncbi:MAG: DNA replication/repair protein RecF [Lactobacillaceae bacterium]|jgi:DNA replication and repair protein RecF|nr:DNA replication/repair protein RecF [Lactobacillaceae bacterium]
MVLNNPNNKIAKSGITRLTLTNFRNYKSLRLNTDLSSIVISGENGTGKTNILEAISFLTPGKGLRGSRLADIKRISDDEDDALTARGWAVAAGVVKDDEEFEIGTGVEKITREDDESSSLYDKRIVKVDGEKLASQGELGKYISAVWLTPQMDRLFRGGSQPRRSFLDRLVYTFDNEHAKRTSSFEHLYKERYHLLKTGKNDDYWLGSIEENMAELGVAIAAARREQIAKLNNFIEKDPDDVFPDVSLELDGTVEKMLDNMSALDAEDKYRSILKSQRKNILYNETTEGVNRTDFKVYYQKKSMPAELCSTGEQKSLLISIILAQTKLMSIDRGFSPIMLLDEVVSHLDEYRREALIEKIKALNVQAWITSTDAALFSSLKKDAQFFIAKDNSIVQGE